MAYPLPTKGRAMALLLTGESISDVRKATGVPPRTLRRWRDLAFDMLIASLKKTPEGRKLLSDLKQLAAGLHELQEEGRGKMSAKRDATRVVVDI